LVLPELTEKKTYRELQKEETRRHILLSAYHLFEKNGYDNTTMRQLAAYSGVGLGTAFKHFPDKASLLVAAFESDIQKVIEKAFDTIPNENIHLQFQHILSEVYGYYAKKQALSRALVKEALFIGGEAGRIIHAQTMAFLESVTALIQGAVKRDEIAAIENTTDAITGFWSSYLFGLTVGLRDKEFDVKQQVATVGQLLQKHFPTLLK
jgi:AcrR family transcriptional regulator